jgi:hypothetical protein
VNPEQQALCQLVQTLERLDIPHMVTGSVASNWHEIKGS